MFELSQRKVPKVKSQLHPKRNFQANTISDLGLLIQTIRWRWSSTPRFIKAVFNFANPKIQTLFASYGIKEAYSPGKPGRKPFKYFK